MTRLSPLKPLLMLTLLLNFSTACTKTVHVPTPVYPPRCDVGQPPDFPPIQTQRCGDNVCLTPQDATEIWLYVRNVDRFIERVVVCNPPSVARTALAGYTLSVKETLEAAFQGWGF